MHSYLKYNEKKISDFSDKNIETHYTQGYIFGRIDKGIMNQTRSVRINLENFKFNSENRRILKKTAEINMDCAPLPRADYHWSIGKMAKDFYETKFGKKTFSVFKIKEILTNAEKSNFNKLLIYKNQTDTIGYAVIYETENIVHYSYPFYNLSYPNKNIGMSMMVRAVQYAQRNNKQYIYLGSAQRKSDTYKLQFQNLEWFDYDHKSWSPDLEKLKNILKNLM